MIKLLTGMMLITVAATVIRAGTHPNIFVNANEIAAIKAKVASGEQPWKAAYDKMISAANSAMGQSSLSVTYSGSSSHDYYVQKPYDWSNNMPSPCGSKYCDGQINPLADRADYESAGKFGKAVRDLGLGYAFTGDSRYADKAIHLINVWCIDPATYMTPRNTTSNAIELYITLPGAFYGADLIYNYPGWDAADKSAFLQWVRDFALDIATDHYKNNWEDWRQVFMASAGVLCDDTNIMNNAFNRFKQDLTDHIGPSGEMTQELWRTKSLSYSTFALLPMTEVAEIARHQGIDLYGYTVSGRNLELAWDYHVQYMLNPSSWPEEQISAYKGENTALYEMAYMIKGKSTYMQVINKYGRPMHDSRVMAYVTLTHAAGLDATPIVLMPSINPAGGSFTGSVQVTVSCATEGAEIRFTTDGTEPAAGSPLYNGPVTLKSSVTLKAKAFKSGVDPSDVATADFVITVDEAAPVITGISVGGDSTRLMVLFDELVDPATAGDRGNYQIDGLVINAADPEADGKSVLLTVSPMEDGTVYRLTAGGIKDRAASPNTMTPVNVDFTYHSSFVDDFDANRLSWTPQTVTRWGLDNDDGDKSYHINTTDYDNAGDKPGEMSLLEGITVSDFELRVDIRSPEPSTNGYADGGVVFGYTDANNFYYFLANTNDDDNQLFKVTNGSRMDLLTMDAPLITDNGYHTLKIVSSGGKVAIWWDGVKKGEVVESIPAGQVGLCSYNDEVYFDDFELVPGGTGGGTTVIREPIDLHNIDMGTMTTGIFTIGGQRVHQLRQPGVYLLVIEINGVKKVKRFVAVAE